MRTRFLVAGSIAFAVLLLGCGGAERETPEPSPGPETPGEPDRGELQAPSRPLGEFQISITPAQGAGLETVREYTRMFYAGELDRLHERFSPEMRSDVMPLDKLRELREFVRRTYGDETEVVGEDSQTKGDYRGFARWARFSAHEGVIEVQWILRPDDSVAGFFVRPAGAGKRP